MIVKTHFNDDFTRKFLAGTGFCIQLGSPCQGIVFLTGACISSINHLAPMGSQYSREVAKATTVVIGNISLILNVQ